MSEFIKRLQAIPTHERAMPNFMPPLSYTMDTVSARNDVYEYRHVYNLEVVFRQTITCMEDEVPDMIRLGKKQIAKALYKDFEEGLVKLDMALYEQDAEVMRKHIKNLYQLIEV